MSKQTKGVDEMTKNKSPDVFQDNHKWSNKIDRYLVDTYTDIIEEGIASPGDFWREYAHEICMSDPTLRKNEAGDYIVDEGTDFAQICESLEIDPNDTPTTLLVDYYTNRAPFLLHLQGTIEEID